MNRPGHSSPGTRPPPAGWLLCRLGHDPGRPLASQPVFLLGSERGQVNRDEPRADRQAESPLDEPRNLVGWGGRPQLADGGPDHVHAGHVTLATVFTASIL
jgi:hypothetical protein